MSSVTRPTQPITAQKNGNHRLENHRPLPLPSSARPETAGAGTDPPPIHTPADLRYYFPIERVGPLVPLHQQALCAVGPAVGPWCTAVNTYCTRRRRRCRHRCRHRRRRCRRRRHEVMAGGRIQTPIRTYPNIEFLLGFRPFNYKNAEKLKILQVCQEKRH